MKTYHLPCGIKFGALNEYYGNFDSYCPSHRSKREVKPHKGKSKNYVLTDLGLVPEHVDREAGFNSEKYREMLRKIEMQYGEKKKRDGVEEIKEVKKEKPIIKSERKKRESYDEKLEEIKARPGPKSKTIIMKKKKFDEEEEEERQNAKKKKISSPPGPAAKKMSSPGPSEPPRRPSSAEEEADDGRRKGSRVRKTFGSDIYKSAKEELEAMLKKKELVNLDDTFMNLAGTRRTTKSAYSKTLGEEDEDDEDTAASKRSKKARAAKRAMVEVDDEDDEEEFGFKRSPSSQKGAGQRPGRKTPHPESEEEDPRSFKKILKKKKQKSGDSPPLSEDDEPSAKTSIRSIRIKPMPERKKSPTTEEEKPTKSLKSKKVLTPEPEESDSEEPVRRKPGPKSRKALTPESKGDSNDEEVKRSPRSKKTTTHEKKEGSSDEEKRKSPRGRRILTPEPKASDSEEETPRRKSRSQKKKLADAAEPASDSVEEPRRKPGPKSRKVLTPELKESDEEKKRSPRNTKTSTPEKKENSDEEQIPSPKRSPLAQPMFTDSEDEEAPTKKKKEAESIESIAEFLTGSKVKEKKDSDSGSDLGVGKKIKLTKVKKTVVDSGDEDSGSPPIPETEFEDTEPDTILENMAQNDGFTDTSGLVSANVSDEGADLDRANFYDDEDEDVNADFSNIISKLDVHMEDEPSWRAIDNCYRFKCKLCGLDSRNQEKLEEHIRSTHNKKIPGKMLKKQEMMIHIERKRLSQDDQEMAEKMVDVMIKCKTLPQKDICKKVPEKEKCKKIPEKEKEKGKKVPEKEKVLTNPQEGKKKAGPKSKQEKEPEPAELTGELYPFFKYANDDVTDAMVDKGKKSGKVVERKGSKTPESEASEDNIDSLLEDAPEKPMNKKCAEEDETVETSRSRKKKDENDASIPTPRTPRGKKIIKEKEEEEDEGKKSSEEKSVETPRSRRKKNDEDTSIPTVRTPRGKKHIIEEEKDGINGIEEKTKKNGKTAAVEKRGSKTPEPEASDDNIDELLEDSPQKPMRKQISEENEPVETPRSRRKKDVISPPILTPRSSRGKKQIEEKEDLENGKEEEKTKKSGRKTTVGKDFILWENESKSGSTRSSRSSRQGNGDEPPSGRSSRQSSKVAEDERDPLRISNSDDTPDQSDTEKKDDEPVKNRRKSPPKKRVGSEDRGAGALSPIPSAAISGPVFECLKCDMKLMQRKDLVKKHLEQHKLTFESYIGNYKH